MNRLHNLLLLIFSFCILLTGLNFAQVKINHMPLGYDNLYDEREVEISTVNIEREPRDPLEGQSVFIQFSTLDNTNMTCFVEVYKNGTLMRTFEAEVRFFQNGESFWTCDIGSFKKGDLIKYSIYASINDSNAARTEFYQFTVTAWDYITQVSKNVFQNNCLTLYCASTNPAVNPVITLAFNSESSVVSDIYISDPPLNKTSKVQSEYRQADGKVYLTKGDIELEINLNPYHISLNNTKKNKSIVKQFPSGRLSSVGLLNDNKTVSKIRESFYSEETEKFYGFGERYNSLNQRGNIIDNYVSNIWKEQGFKTYIPVPFYFTNSGYGFFLNSTYYSNFNLDKNKEQKCTITANYGNDAKPYEYYLFASEDMKQIISSFAEVTCKPAELEVWSLGPWISANEWDKQSEVEAALDSLERNKILNTVVVVEAWSDEETFYIFNDASYKLKPASEFYHLNDFTFSGRWPDPVGLIKDIHQNNMKIVLWNIPVLKHSQVQSEQRDIDEKYAIENKFIAQNPDGTPNRLPPAWFGRSLNFDFTNQKAVDWWLGKRTYLIDEMKVDGFKVDGGEFVWGRDVAFSNGMKGSEMRNLYANLYIEAYYKYLQEHNKDAIVFHRAGTFGAQSHPIAWNGDQNSSFKGFREAIRSVLNLSVSGIPFVAYDLAGYFEETNFTAELYKRSTAQAAFSPVMQFHSGYGGDTGLERSPWNAARLFKDPTCINIYRKYANLRFNLIPYLYSEAAYTSETTVPLMRPLFLEYQHDEKAISAELDYMLGNSLIVFPVSSPGTKKDVYLPEGAWYDFWTLKEVKGGQSYKYDVPVDQIPVFIKEGSIVPLNMNQNFGFSEGITNDLKRYENLSFYIFPKGNIEYRYHDYTTNSVKVIKETAAPGSVSISLPSFEYNTSLVVKVPGFASVDGGLKEFSSFDQFTGTGDSYYYSKTEGILYIKLRASGDRTINIKTADR